MIAALLAFGIAAQTHVIEVPIQGADFVSVAAVFKTPPFDPQVRASADVLAQIVTNDNDNYTKQAMRDLCIPGGQPRCYAMGDHLAIELSVLPADTAAGMRMLAAMVSSARMNMDVMNGYLLTEPYRHKAVWSEALDDEDRAWDRLRVADISNLYHVVFRPNNVTIAVGGAVRAGQAQAAWDDASSSWQRQYSLPLRHGEPFKDFPHPYPSHVLELRGTELAADDPAFAGKLLALVALGGGKASTLFTDIREARALSYRQEAALWPTENGFAPRLLFQIKPLSHDAEMAELSDIRKDLIDDISKWSGATLQRAQGYGAAMATDGMPLSPLYFRPDAPLGSSVADQTLLAAYWQMKTGRPWDGDAMVEAFKTVDLKTIQDQATTMVKAAIPIVHPKPLAQ